MKMINSIYEYTNKNNYTARGRAARCIIILSATLWSR